MSKSRLKNNCGIIKSRYKNNKRFWRLVEILYFFTQKYYGNIMLLGRFYGQK